jgi:2-keto-4-pentenoate hydratase/2-oxohepta-3-ene-1,7-dioic acid hydratase in catechol pathway
MKFICIGRNYVEHAKELNNAVPSEPVIFFKPETALLVGRQPFFYPEFSKDIHYECEIVVRINRLGKNIQKKFAHRYYDEIGLGIDFTARDLQNKLKEKGLPWEKAKGFDGSAVLGKFVPVSHLKNPKNIEFQLLKNGSIVQCGFSKDMIFDIDAIIEHVSQFVTLKIGDVIFTGTPAGVGPVAIGDQLEGLLEGEHNFSLLIK